MAKYEKISYERDGDIAIIAFDDDKTLNACGVDTAIELLHALEVAAKEARCTILTGKGGDLLEFRMAAGYFALGIVVPGISQILFVVAVREVGASRTLVERGERQLDARTADPPRPQPVPGVVVPPELVADLVPALRRRLDRMGRLALQALFANTSPSTFMVPQVVTD